MTTLLRIEIKELEKHIEIYGIAQFVDGDEDSGELIIKNPGIVSKTVHETSKEQSYAIKIIEMPLFTNSIKRLMGGVFSAEEIDEAASNAISQYEFSQLDDPFQGL